MPVQAFDERLINTIIASEIVILDVRQSWADYSEARKTHTGNDSSSIVSSAICHTPIISKSAVAFATLRLREK